MKAIKKLIISKDGRVQEVFVRNYPNDPNMIERMIKHYESQGFVVKEVKP
jgi:hypothetical protein